jgi:transposase-like protein
MPLSAQALSAIQSAGASVFSADVEIKDAVRQYAEQVNIAMLQNAFDIGNDSLFEDWKTVARLSQALSQIEQELKKVHKIAAGLAAGAPSPISRLRALAAPSDYPAGFVEVLKEIKATDVVAKRAGSKVKTAGHQRKSALPPRGNTARLLNWLVKTLKNNEFVKLNRSAVAVKIGLPKGSIGASFNKLLNAGYIVEGDAGQFKLGLPKA